jgi:predicted nucleic acid-binding Zn ribbon protein
MPVYAYCVVLPDGSDGTYFEVVQSMSDPALTHHPETGEPVRRVITAPNLVLRHGARQDRRMMSNENLTRKGFTKYEKTGPGEYVRTAGTEGPSTLSRDRL